MGLSTGLFYAPQSYAQTAEVIAVARAAAAHGGIYDSHLRDESSYSIGLLPAVREALEIGREATMPVHIAHIKALGVDVQGQSGAVIDLIEQALKTKGHPMQEYSTFKMALLDIIEVIRALPVCCESTANKSAAPARKKSAPKKKTAAKKRS